MRATCLGGCEGGAWGGGAGVGWFQYRRFKCLGWTIAGTVESVKSLRSLGSRSLILFRSVLHELRARRTGFLLYQVSCFISQRRLVLRYWLSLLVGWCLTRWTTSHAITGDLSEALSFALRCLCFLKFCVARSFLTGWSRQIGVRLLVIFRLTWMSFQPCSDVIGKVLRINKLAHWIAMKCIELESRSWKFRPGD